ncbi:MAG: RsbRD N-terminal domain-containing protein [Acidobacteriota bacterium]|nr:RsbRD N-terminal domain-containing protein [Acidobacteriota bacterium]
MASNMDALCTAMRTSIDAITLDWVQRVKEDPYLKSDDPLPLTQIVDHVPQMLEELCGVFTQEGEPDFEDIRASSQHGYTRSMAGYTLTELLRELELLRDCVFNFVVETETKQGVNRADTLRALRLVNQYFGEDIVFVVEHYLKRNAATQHLN